MTTHLENHLLNIAKDNTILIIKKRDELEQEFLLEGKYLDLAKQILLAEKKITSLELKTNRNIIEAILDGVEFKLGTTDEMAQTVRNFNEWVKHNHKEHIYLKTQTENNNDKTDSVVLINRDQTRSNSK